MNPKCLVPIKGDFRSNFENQNMSNNLSSEELLVVEKMIKTELKPFQDKVDERFSDVKTEISDLKDQTVTKFTAMGETLVKIQLMLGWKTTVLQITAYALVIIIPMGIFFFSLMSKLNALGVVK